MNALVFLETFLLTEVFEKSLVVDWSEESLPATDVFLTIITNLQPLLVILQAGVGTELLNVTTKSNGETFQVKFLTIPPPHLTEYLPILAACTSFLQEAQCDILDWKLSRQSWTFAVTSS